MLLVLLVRQDGIAIPHILEVITCSEGHSVCSFPKGF